MRRILLFLVLASLAYAQPADAKSPVGVVRNFGPDVSTRCNLPEGIAADTRGRIYASSLNFNATIGRANICVLDRAGTIVDVIVVEPATPSGVAKLLGMLFVPNEGLYVTDIGGGRVIRVDVGTHAVTPIASGFQALNAIARDRLGNLWISDSGPGTITKIAPGGVTTTYSYPTELAPRSGEIPQFGANGSRSTATSASSMWPRRRVTRSIASVTTTAPSGRSGSSRSVTLAAARWTVPTGSRST